MNIVINGLNNLKTNKIMKNIHLLPTDKIILNHKKGSICKYIYNNRKNQPLILSANDCFETGSHYKFYNIYITSDEEINDGYWFLDDNNQISRSYRLSHVQFANPKKIILTTDQDLIKDGVQAIDDEFLEWFVKNPSCEEIEVDWVDFSQSYFIKIPKEELKQETIEEDLDEIKNIRLWLKDRKQRFIEQFKNK